jgi:uncharacterized protein YjbJ (UPF0337 family)
LDLKGVVREKWAKLTDDDFALIAGKKDRLLGKLHVRYGMAKEEAEKELDGFIKTFDAANATKPTP